MEATACLRFLRTQRNKLKVRGVEGEGLKRTPHPTLADLLSSSPLILLSPPP